MFLPLTLLSPAEGRGSGWLFMNQCALKRVHGFGFYNKIIHD